jgi:hypothetical protein
VPQVPVPQVPVPQKHVPQEQALQEQVPQEQGMEEPSPWYQCLQERHQHQKSSQVPGEVTGGIQPGGAEHECIDGEDQISLLEKEIQRSVANSGEDMSKENTDPKQSTFTEGEQSPENLGLSTTGIGMVFDATKKNNRQFYLIRTVLYDCYVKEGFIFFSFVKQDKLLK